MYEPTNEVPSRPAITPLHALHRYGPPQAAVGNGFPSHHDAAAASACAFWSSTEICTAHTSPVASGRDLIPMLPAALTGSVGPQGPAPRGQSLENGATNRYPRCRPIIKGRISSKR